MHSDLGSALGLIFFFFPSLHSLPASRTRQYIQRSLDPMYPVHPQVHLRFLFWLADTNPLHPLTCHCPPSFWSPTRSSILGFLDLCPEALSAQLFLHKVSMGDPFCFGAKRSRFEAGLSHWWAVWSWMSPFASLRLSSYIYKRGIILMMRALREYSVLVNIDS